MGTGTDPAILITLIVIAILVLIAIVVIFSLKSKADKQTGSLKSIEKKLEAMEQADTGNIEAAEATGAEETPAGETPAEEPAAEETPAEEPGTDEEPETAEAETTEEPEAEEAESEPAEAAAEEKAEDADEMKTEIDFSEELSEFENLFKKEGLDFSDIKPSEETDAATGTEKAPAEETVAETAAEETPAEDGKAFIKNYNTGRSGHEYSKEELEAQIRI